MKIKIFYKKHQQSIEAFEEQVNDFIANVEIVDIKYTEATCGDYEAISSSIGILVIYQG